MATKQESNINLGAGGGSTAGANTLPDLNASGGSLIDNFVRTHNEREQAIENIRSAALNPHNPDAGFFVRHPVLGPILSSTLGALAGGAIAGPVGALTGGLSGYTGAKQGQAKYRQGVDNAAIYRHQQLADTEKNIVFPLFQGAAASSNAQEGSQIIKQGIINGNDDARLPIPMPSFGYRPNAGIPGAPPQSIGGGVMVEPDPYRAPSQANPLQGGLSASPPIAGPAPLQFTSGYADPTQAASIQTNARESYAASMASGLKAQGLPSEIADAYSRAGLNDASAKHYDTLTQTEIKTLPLKVQELMAGIRQTNTQTSYIPFKYKTERIGANASGTSAAASLLNAKTNRTNIGSLIKSREFQDSLTAKYPPGQTSQINSKLNALQRAIDSGYELNDKGQKVLPKDPHRLANMNQAVNALNTYVQGLNINGNSDGDGAAVANYLKKFK